MTFWTDLLGIPFEVKFVDAGGVRTRVLKLGSGEPVVFLHGISGHLEGYCAVARDYAERHEVHMIDMIGHGYTDSLTVPLTTQVLSDHVIAYLDAAGIDRAHLVGLSLGGWTAAWTAAFRPDRVRSLTLVSAAGDPGAGPGINPTFGPWLRESTRAGVLSDDKSLTRKRLEQVIAKPDDITDELVDVRYAVYHQPNFVAALDNLLAMTDTQDYLRWALTPEILGRITCEALVVWGENDVRAGGHGGQYLIDGIAHSKLVVFNHTGHWPPFERPGDFARVGVAFLDGGLAAVQAGEQ